MMTLTIAHYGDAMNAFFLVCSSDLFISSSPEHEVLRMSYCDHEPSVGVRQSVCSPFTFSCLHSSICKYQPISPNLGQNIYDHKILDECDYGSDWTITTGVICPWI